MQVNGCWWNKWRQPDKCSMMPGGSLYLAQGHFPSTWKAAGFVTPCCTVFLILDRCRDFLLQCPTGASFRLCDAAERRSRPVPRVRMCWLCVRSAWSHQYTARAAWHHLLKRDRAITYAVSFERLWRHFLGKNTTAYTAMSEKHKGRTIYIYIFNLPVKVLKSFFYFFLILSLWPFKFLILLRHFCKW